MRLLPSFLLAACGGEVAETATSIESLRHDVEYQVEEGVAELTVRRAFRGVDGELDLEIALPSAGAVDRFRFGFNERWYDGELLEAEAASERYDLLSGLAGEEGYAVEGAPPPALLSYRSDGELQLKAHPIAPHDVIEIEYRVKLPTCHASGRAMFDYPLDEHGPPTFIGAGTVRDPYDDDDFEAACDESSTIVGGERAVIELDPAEELLLTYAVQSLGERTAVRVAIDAPSELAPIPERPLILFVMDGSYSQADDGLADQLAWAKAYLAWVPDADVEVVVFRRDAVRLFERMVPARDFDSAMTALPAETRSLGNGSFLDRGVALAASLADPNRETRIVVTSDLIMRGAFDLEAAKADLGPSPLHILHRSGPEEGEPSLSSYISSELEQLAFATGGLAGMLEGDPKLPAAVEIAEELVHPIRLESIELHGIEVSHGSIIDRGERMRTTALLETVPPHRIEVTAALWSRELSFELPRSLAVDGAMPAILIATAPGLTSEEVLHLATQGGVVSYATSYLAELGGVDPVSPPQELYDSLGLHGGSYGTSCRCGGGISIGSYVENHDFLRGQIRELTEACAAQDAEVWLETTLDEIADVSVTASSGAECLLESIWSLRLPEDYRSVPRSELNL